MDFRRLGDNKKKTNVMLNLSTNEQGYSKYLTPLKIFHSVININRIFY